MKTNQSTSSFRLLTSAFAAVAALLLAGSAHAQTKVPVMASTNGALLSPTNFFGGNTQAMVRALADYLGGGAGEVTTAQLLACSNYLYSISGGAGEVSTAQLLAASNALVSFSMTVSNEVYSAETARNAAVSNAAVAFSMAASNDVYLIETTRNAAVSNAAVAFSMTASNDVYAIETTRNAAVSNALVSFGMTVSNAVYTTETTRNAAVSNAAIAFSMTASNDLFGVETTRNAAVSNALVTFGMTVSNAVYTTETTRNAAVSNAAISFTMTASNDLYGVETTRNAAVSNALVTLYGTTFTGTGANVRSNASIVRDLTSINSITTGGTGGAGTGIVLRDSGSGLAEILGYDSVTSSHNHLSFRVFQPVGAGGLYDTTLYLSTNGQGRVGVLTTGPTNALDVAGNADVRGDLFLPAMASNAAPVNLVGQVAGGPLIKVPLASNAVVVTAGANITVTPSGSGGVMSFAVASTGGGGGGTNYPPVIANGGGQQASTNVTVGSGVRQRLTITTNASFKLVFTGTPLNGEQISIGVSNLAATAIFVTNTVFDPSSNTNVTTLGVAATSVRWFDFVAHTNWNLGTVRWELVGSYGQDFTLVAGNSTTLETNGNNVQVNWSYNRNSTTVSGTGNGSTNYALVLETNGVNVFYMGSSNVNLNAIYGSTIGQPIRFNLHITNLSGINWGFFASAVTNRWLWTSQAGTTNGPSTVFTNATRLEIEGIADGTNITAWHRYLKPAF